MATNENENSQANPDEGQNTNDNTDAGDIISQLKAESASISNLYKLESKLLKIVTNADKTLTKEYKLINQSKRNLDSVNAAVKSIDKNVSTVSTTLTSVDRLLRQILTALGQTTRPGSNSGSNSGSSSRSEDESGPANAILRLENSLDNLIKRQQDLISEYGKGTISDSEFTQKFDDLTQQISTTNKNLQNERDIAEAFAAIGDYSKVPTREDRYENEVLKLLDEFKNEKITKADFDTKLEELHEGFSSTQDAISDAAADWKDNGEFKFANFGNRRRAEAEQDYEDRYKDLVDKFQNGLLLGDDGNPMSGDQFQEEILKLSGERNSAFSDIDKWIAAGESLDKFVSKWSSGATYNVQTGENHTAQAAAQTAGEIGGIFGGAAAGAAIGTAIGGPVGTVVGGILGDLIGSKIEALGQIIGDQLDYLANHSKKTRDEILKAGFDKIRNDVKDMATYSIDIYKSAADSIYASWDKNLAQVTATQGYTKEALNSLQDSVAQRLQEEGYGATINASEYVDQLANTLNANLGGPLAEAFAAQNLILQKAVPEVDLSTSAAQFAAIYTNANRQSGNGEETMISAMNEIAGAAKALEEVTDGNNQFLKQTDALLTKATEVVGIAGGNADQIAELTTQMMASEAAITSLSPQLSGFTGELVSILMNNNDSTAVALRAIMNDIDSSIGVSSTSFMQSFMEDTQGTLSTAFAAIQRFIDQNENEASRQEFLHAMESVFGMSGSKLAQVDFGSVSNLISQVNTNTNMAALTDAENLVRSGETTTMEEQLLANTANQLLATNAISATLDNKLMRKLETNEIQMEKMVYSAQATQSVDLAENTMGFFTKISDLIMSILDPFGLFDMLTNSINSATSAAIDAERYLVTSTMSNIGSTVADSSAGIANTLANTVGGASAVMAAAQTKSTDAMVAAVEMAGVSPTFEHMMLDYSAATQEAQAAIAASSEESNAVSYASMEQQAKQSSEYQQKQKESEEQQAKYEEDKAAAREEQKAKQEAEDIRNLENHDNIVIIKDALETLDMSEWLTPILDEHRTHTEQIKDLQAQTVEIVRLLSTFIEYNMVFNPEFASTISYDERSRIMDNGYITDFGNGIGAFL